MVTEPNLATAVLGFLWFHHTIYAECNHWSISIGILFTTDRGCFTQGIESLPLFGNDFRSFAQQNSGVEVRKGLEGFSHGVAGAGAGPPEVAMRSPAKPGFRRSRKCAQLLTVTGGIFHSPEGGRRRSFTSRRARLGSMPNG
ncbi:MAG: hypothetical protein LBK61_00880 [Spirochaetaceae bacterium]|jgi:hypothetical protein|nr:hypothetical protein [Spirochaetaceae bacterium]